MSEIDIDYADGPLSKGRLAGRRLDPLHYAGAPPGSGPAPRWSLYAADTERATILASRFGGLLESAPRPPHDATRMLIVRPDGYVGFAAGRKRWTDAERYLAEIAVAGAAAPGPALG